MTKNERLIIMEKVFHDINFYGHVVMDGEKVKDIIQLVCAWSYAHRQGNGMFSDSEIQKRTDNILVSLRDYPEKK